MRIRHDWALPLLAVALVAGGVVSGCRTVGAEEAGHGLAMAPLADMPPEVRQSPASVRQAYQFAVANPGVLRQIPCYCGCGAMGHTSNYACYVAGVHADGTIVYDPHALGCSICVDITRDAMRLLKQGQSLTEIRAYVEDHYAKFGPSNMP